MLTARDPEFCCTARSVAATRVRVAFSIAAFCTTADFRSSVSVIFSVLTTLPVSGATTTSL
jgi:hypothetical protein